MSGMDPQDARQGRKGTPVLRVLVIALLLCVVAAVGMAAYAWVMPDQTLPDASIGGGAGASTQSPPEPAAGSTTTPAESGTDPSATAPATSN